MDFLKTEKKKIKESGANLGSPAAVGPRERALACGLAGKMGLALCQPAQRKGQRSRVGQKPTWAGRSRSA